MGKKNRTTKRSGGSNPEQPKPKQKTVTAGGKKSNVMERQKRTLRALGFIK